MRILKLISFGVGGLFLSIQLLPYGRVPANPPVMTEPRWDSPSTRALAARACFDCHSNQTRWPWYSRIAPASWLVRRDVEDGRAAFNFSEWSRTDDRRGVSPEVVLAGEMPLPGYLLLNPRARLSAQERRALAQGLNATLRAERRREQ